MNNDKRELFLEFGSECTPEGFIPIIRLRLPQYGNVTFTADIVSNKEQDCQEFQFALVHLLENLNNARRTDLVHN